jgi:hypothetical protein
VIHLEATVDRSASPPLVEAVSVDEDVWIEFGYWLDALAVVGLHARAKQAWDTDQLLAYTRDYLRKALDNYDALGGAD